MASFTGIAGDFPGSKPHHGALLRHSDGNFYGTTSDRGPGGGGTLFRVRFGPVPTTKPAVVSGLAATLFGIVNPNQGITTVEFEWGTSPTLATYSTVFASSLAAGNVPTTVSASIGGLTVGTTYYYRTKATNPYNTSPQRGAILSFSLTPDILVEQPAGFPLTDGSGRIDFGHSPNNVGTTRVITLTNTGLASLNSLVVSRDGAQAGDFNVISPAVSSLAPGASTTFSVTFLPTASGDRSAVLHIASNVMGNKNPFDIALVGIGGASPTELEKWRLQWFGTSSGVGNAADDASPLQDGIPNLLKFATAMNPLQPGKMPGQMVRNGASLEFTYTRAKAAMTQGLNFQVEWNDDLQAFDWSTAGVVESILFQDSVVQQMKAIIPAGNGGRRYVHLRVIQP